jgi:hypothetical protein
MLKNVAAHWALATCSLLKVKPQSLNACMHEFHIDNTIKRKGKEQVINN